ncbi:GNAT family N-acetyltransferase [Actinoplanes regularis]|uniref:Ribosomal protein S18 acetylase RimI n=1 Tax=Actinoplanes regularis TaxID=52697 RepID=A0A238YRK0_9ACTN|nr:GNAT family N-acetyltransferase [Actinoplanes regularis]GIE85486.1 N-acetyltransferase [Actinoplanes regularis]SNR73438.1 Ribosomal protein S18 acetylase RimI [Actinoplanes regularis]
MINIRRATAADAAELVRLRGILIAAMQGHQSENDEWRQRARMTLEKRLIAPEPTLVAFVVEQPDAPSRLAACAVGTVEERLGGPGNPSGLTGYVFNVATDPAHRRRGYSRLCTTALLDWYRDHGIATVDLRATAPAEPLYRSLGFVRTTDPAMRLHITATI